MKRPLVRLAIAISAFPGAQPFLERLVSRLLQLMGIGLGGSTDLSGEKAVLKELRRRHGRTGEPLCIFDVGANKGKFLELIEKELRGTRFHVHAFEPSRRTYEALCANAGGRPNVTLNNVGLGRRPGRMELHSDADGSGLASLYDRRLEHHGIELKNSETVEIVTLDDYCREHNIRKIDLLKLDVEGHELEVLKGGAELFNRKAIAMASFEFGGCNIDSRTFFQDFYYFFKDCGMRSICRIPPSGRLRPIRRYDEIHEQFRTTNFLVSFQDPEAPGER